MKKLWRLYLMLLLQLIKETAGCSPYCVCLWKNGKQTVECRKKNLSEIPDGLEPATQVLDFPGNKLEILHKDVFVKKQLLNLQRLYLSHSMIKSIHSDAFQGLTNLVELDLSNNLLEAVPSETLIRCPSLMKLTLNSNPISSLKKSAFEHLTQLNTLELSDCTISDIEEGAFQGLHSLEWLHLDGNRLKTIPGGRTLPEYVKGIELEKNSWECDCHIQELAMWLKNFKRLLSVEPVCQGPPRLAAKTIRSIPLPELACLPSISPTSFYLEIGEGKNVSLVCHVQAVPEATVSWWFQGQILQNDTMIAPGVHLLYFVEEGTENKKSELFIYNANAEDNGTFVCNAENIAGVSQSNFTIKIILKENPIVIIVSFPFEYVLIGIVGISILGMSVIIALVALIVKCRMRSRRKKNPPHNDEYQINQIPHNGGVAGEAVKNLNDSFKQPIAQERIENLTAYEISTCQLPNSNLSPSRNEIQIRNLETLKEIQLKQNPDIINGCRREGDGQDHQNIENEFIQPLQLPLARLRESTEFLDGTLRFVDPEGYPLDYGLPKLPCRTQKQFSDGYYRTLPSNRLKRHSAANPFRRISREAEFLSRSVDSQYDNSVDVRYTADGYPARPSFPTDTIRESTPPSSLPYCSVQWPTCVPANVHVLDPNLSLSLNSNVTYHQQPPNLSKRSASAQTDNNSDECPDNKGQQFLSASRSNVNDSESGEIAQNDSLSEVLTESPDEGYEGEPSVV
ncbi:unnamed protein product [Phyllotreta striolata]|uniref:Ig-like domain-containing protein n=1 Tax=Phyllotreta striolata TaxID=444603 RepID=A0A9N9TPJ4_PHYSR|nr:unnamed protein product [Phyllotreta striolata]